MNGETVVLAFSGGLDTSYCVPYLVENGYQVVTVFVDTGGVSSDELNYIEQRSEKLGASQHHTIDGADDLWQQIVVPLVRGGQWYQGQYPVLCADRYIVVNKALEICRQLGTNKIAHGCTAMGNDQVRFDLTVMAAPEHYEILSPVRTLQSQCDEPRQFEMAFLRERGFSIPDKTSRYTINENLLGVTISGSEIDQWQAPGDATWQLTANPQNASTTVAVTFEKGVPVALDHVSLPGPKLLATLNHSLGKLGVGRGIYAGDTAVGLKGRIAFEAPALSALKVAHQALEEATCTYYQNLFKPQVAQRWVELIYFGFFNEALRLDLEQYIVSSQQRVSGTVDLQIDGRQVQAVAVDSPHLLRDADAVYAQKADWTVEEARGFIRLFGQSSRLHSKSGEPDD